MKPNAKEKQMRLRAQTALALTLGMGILPAAAHAAPITSSQTYTADTTETRDVEITGGTITVEGVDDNTSSQHANRTATLTGNVRIINPSGNVLEALSHGDGTEDWTGILTVNPNGTKRVQLHGDILVGRPDNTSERGGYVNLYLSGRDSYFAGGIKDVTGNPPSTRGGVRLVLSNGATWYPKADSYALAAPTDLGETGLTSDPNKPLGFHLSANGGVIDMAFAAPNVARGTGAGLRTLTFANTGASLNGAAFRISTDLAHNHADKVVLSGVTGASNQYKLQVAYDPTMNDADTANYEITTANPNGIEVLRSSNAGDTVRASAYTTRKAAAAGLLAKDFTVTPTLRQEVSGSSKIAYLTKLTISEAPPEDGPALRAADLLMDMALAQLSAWRGENNDLHRRMGALRAGGEPGAWVRGYGGRNEFGSYPTTGRYSGVQAGIDRAVPLKDGTLFTGIAASMMNGSARNSDLDGSYRSHFFGAYGSYMGKRGDYIDAIVKYGRMTNDATAVFDGTAYTGGYGVNGWNISIEYGRRMPLRDHFYWTPQAELNYGHIGSASYTMRAGSMAGAHIDSDAVTSLVGRVGTQIGYEDEQGTVYLKLGILHEFKGDLHMRAAYGSTSIDRSYTARDSYFEYGVGFARRVGRADIYGELSRTAGADAIREKWKANLGVRIEF
ncbi:autotransporter outer membrane beta-barrel domain-containing protein [Selenomonas sputigena]|uniref:Autotransporter outer membrane beta-barrel domain-containing protein n=1 Tax=Selenomonas sputigena TaxID=69823 RepID=A0ABV3X7C9_9FIRM